MTRREMPSLREISFLPKHRAARPRLDARARRASREPGGGYAADGPKDEIWGEPAGIRAKGARVGRFPGARKKAKEGHTHLSEKK